MLKSSSCEQLVHATRVIAAGDALIDPVITRRLIAEFVRRPATATQPAPLTTLTEREREVLVELARGGSNIEIASRLFVSEATVKPHVARLLMKLQVRDRAQAVIYAYEHGVVRPGEAAPNPNLAIGGAWPEADRLKPALRTSRDDPALAAHGSGAVPARAASQSRSAVTRRPAIPGGGDAARHRRLHRTGGSSHYRQSAGGSPVGR